MAKKRLTQALQGLTKSALKLDRNLSVKDRFWLWRSSLISSSADASTQAGFILPTVTLLLLMLSLVLGVLIFRTGNRTNQVIGERQQRQVYNAATPAIDRARSKLEYLFTLDSIPTLPSEENIESALRNAGIYDLNDETRIDLDGDATTLDPAWAFTYDSQGLRGSTGGNEVDDVVVVYSILNKTVEGNFSLQDDDATKAANLLVRNGPINLTGGAGNPNCPPQGRSPYQGWQNVTGAELRKAFQVHAFAISGPNNPNQTVATLEMQQDKVANLGNKWGAWFRTDMEIFPGPAFRWNGAMNTAGSYFARSNGQPGGGNYLLSFYPISAPTSCVFTRDSSEMVMSLITQDAVQQSNGQLNTGQTFQGQLVAGSLRDNDYDGGFDLYGFEAGQLYDIDNGKDSVAQGGIDPIELALEPVVLLTEGINRRRDGAAPVTDAAAADRRDGDWNGREWVGSERLRNEFQPTPFVDDTYRADDRLGPKPVYNDQLSLNSVLGLDPKNPPDNYELNLTEPADSDIPAPVDPDNPSDPSIRLTREAPEETSTTDEESYGLDGYWERRARAQGVRIIVGQRLELGNSYGWLRDVDVNGDGVLDANAGDIDHNRNGLLDFDPLYPPPANPGTIDDGASTISGSMASRQHELMQWKTLRDNPAAAQSTAVYHYLLDEGRYPAACLASAAHPGTKESIEQSTTFNRVDGSTTLPDVNFLTGQGTNGWEFAPFGVEVAGDGTLGARLGDAAIGNARGRFEDAMASGDSPLRIALSNLAYFSGDLAGAFPAFQDTDAFNAADSAQFRDAAGRDSTIGPVTHPYPILTMWGDFSNLRRVINKLDNGTTYGDLSLADQTTLQTASCTLGILAYNIENETGNVEDLSSGRTTQLTRELRALSDGDLSNGEIGQIDEDNPDDLIVYEPRAGAPREQRPLDETRVLFRAKAATTKVFNPFPATDPSDSIPIELIAKVLPAESSELVEVIQREQQIERDRLMGFNEGKEYTVLANHPGGILGVPFSAKGRRINLQCDFEANNYFGLGQPRRPADEQRFLELAFTLCPTSAKYPSLYYLFPKANHDHIGNVPAGLSSEQTERYRFLQPDDEPYTSSSLQLNNAPFNNSYAYNRANDNGANISGLDIDRARFRVVGDSSKNPGIADSPDSGEEGLAAIALVPKSPAAWALPSENNGNRENAITDAVTNAGANAPNTSVAMLDTGIFNGREQMGVRLLNIDLDLLRRNRVIGSGTYQNEDYWMPLPILIDPDESPTRTGAAFYAFREDAVREDGVARPRRVANDADDWREAWREYSLGNRNPNYVMNAAAFNTPEEQDPPLNPANGLSPKAVDYYADPSRRPHGFRLLRGVDLSRVDNGAPVPDERGMSFVSDNAVYVQGDFNVHSPDGDVNDLIEEYQGASLLDEDWTNFFGRAGNDLDQRFARAASDTWRATEIVTDAINILSDDFADGWVSQGIFNANGSGEARSSFRALNYPVDGDNLSWVGADGRLFYAEGDESRDDAIPGRDENDTVDNPEGKPSRLSVKISQRGFPVYCAVPGGNDDISTALGANSGDPTQTSCTALGGEEREYGLQTTNQAFLRFEDQREDLQAAINDNYVNALVVSGIIPSRVNQANGGLHNFLRTIEAWDNAGVDLWFSGSLFQLNFSTASTGPYDQDAWEPDGNDPLPGFQANVEQIWYYRPPGRRWGYDVALQYVQPPPVAQRFAGRTNIRSEFFQELPVDDPYIALLRCVDYNGAQVDETATCN